MNAKLIYSLEEKMILSGKQKVSAEILKCGGAKMELFWHRRLVTNFKHGLVECE